MKIVENKKAPGRQLIKRMDQRTKWILLTLFSLLMIAYGLTVYGRAIWLYGSGEPTVKWVLTGGYALILLLGGLMLFANALRIRLQMDFRRELRRFVRKNRRLFAPKKENTPGKKQSPKGREKENPAGPQA
ncbi:hypothetical protein [Siphonobacter aquaeclarae]|jgi:hypothetical protein|uniref:Uncharacterized protein n=1 Tax=Siphonobacter aquaeclarae TaxID=563176 RepID=A0A1G9TIR4_9BACT|nr:hypothetical protein [Siphonobacter aquaeclarae]SDM47601.1 hypothetical protein SAMN04488090_3579 [Siphonobacter aquaeclarae]